MLFDYKFKGNTAVANVGERTEMSFAPDTNRQPTYFAGQLHKALEFREAISALHDVVVSDLRYQPKDKIRTKPHATTGPREKLGRRASRRKPVVLRTARAAAFLR